MRRNQQYRRRLFTQVVAELAPAPVVATPRLVADGMDVAEAVVLKIADAAALLSAKFAGHTTTPSYTATNVMMIDQELTHTWRTPARRRNAWYPDTGATSHATPDAHMLDHSDVYTAAMF